MRALAPAAIHPPFAAYSHGVEASARRLVLTSGQLGIREQLERRETRQLAKLVGDLDGQLPRGREDQPGELVVGVDHLKQRQAERSLFERRVHDAAAEVAAAKRPSSAASSISSPVFKEPAIKTTTSPLGGPLF